MAPKKGANEKSKKQRLLKCGDQDLARSADSVFAETGGQKETVAFGEGNAMATSLYEALARKKKQRSKALLANALVAVPNDLYAAHGKIRTAD